MQRSCRDDLEETREPQDRKLTEAATVSFSPRYGTRVVCREELNEDNGAAAEDGGENEAVGGENGCSSWEKTPLDIRVREENTLVDQ